MRLLFALAALLLLVAPAAVQAQSRLHLHAGVGATSAGGVAFDGSVGWILPESRTGAESVLVGVHGVHSRAIQPVESLFPVPDDTLTTQAVTFLVGRSLRSGYRERGAIALTPAVGVGVMRHRTTRGAGVDRRVFAGTVLVDVRARLLRISRTISLDLLATPSLSVSTAAAVGAATLGAGLTFGSD